MGVCRCGTAPAITIVGPGCRGPRAGRPQPRSARRQDRHARFLRDRERWHGSGSGAGGRARQNIPRFSSRHMKRSGAAIPAGWLGALDFRRVVNRGGSVVGRAAGGLQGQNRTVATGRALRARASGRGLPRIAGVRGPGGTRTVPSRTKGGASGAERIGACRSRATSRRRERHGTRRRSRVGPGEALSNGHASGPRSPQGIGQQALVTPVRQTTNDPDGQGRRRGCPPGALAGRSALRRSRVRRRPERLSRRGPQVEGDGGPGRSRRPARPARAPARSRPASGTAAAAAPRDPGWHGWSGP